MRVLFLPFAPSLAHVSRCLAVAEACRGRGHSVQFALGAERVAMVRAAGYDTRPVPEVSAARFRTDRGFSWLTAHDFRERLQAEEALIAELRPDVLVSDFCFSANSSARLSGIPSASILHGNGLRLALRPAATAQALLGGPQSIVGRLLGPPFALVFRAIMGRVAGRLTPQLTARGLPAVRTPFELLLGDAVLLADVPVLAPDHLPGNCHLVGPLFWSGWEREAPWLDSLDARPLLYVTMGSTVEAGALLTRLIDALRGAPYQAVVTAGGVALPAGLDPPPNVRLFETVPGATVAGRSVAVVHHGGHETLMQALRAGVPSLVIPANPDQIMVAQQVQALHLGHTTWRPGDLRPGGPSSRRLAPGQIRQRIDLLLADQDCGETCQRFARELVEYHGAADSAAIIERLPSQLRQPGEP